MSRRFARMLTDHLIASCPQGVSALKPGEVSNLVPFGPYILF